MVTYHLELDFATICSGYVDGLSTKGIQSLGESLLSHAKLVAEKVSTQWVMDARRADLANGMRQEDVAHPTNRVELGLEMNVAPLPTEPIVVPPESEQPMPLPVALIADVTGEPQ